eukprot:m.544272 g.544272  ORF g.544272 m.544272 type:complete len:69 (-) comp354048_c0_seq1:64-270(-)
MTASLTRSSRSQTEFSSASTKMAFSQWSLSLCVGQAWYRGSPANDVTAVRIPHTYMKSVVSLGSKAKG